MKSIDTQLFLETLQILFDTSIFRYVEANVRRSSRYRSYNEVLPLWLHNRPIKFVNHCVEKIGLAHNIAKSNIKQIDDAGKLFSVRSSKYSDEYQVSLGFHEQFPSCECAGWKSTMLPCKHMLAVFDKVEGISWASLPDSYTLSPFLNIDYSVINVNGVDRTLSNTTESNIAFVETENDNVDLLAIPKKMYPKRSKASSCREVLGQIRSLTYLVYDSEALEDLEEKLLDLLSEFSGHAPNDDGIITERVESQRRSVVKKYADTIPKAKARKSALTGRVGIAAEARKFSSVISVNPPALVKEAKVKEEFPSLDDAIYIDDECENDVEENRKNAGDEKMEDDNEDIEKQNGTTEDAENELVITKEVEGSGPIRKSRKLVFSKMERNTILNNEMLTDESINIAQILLQKQFPNIGGFQDTVIGKVQEFDTIPGSKKYIQILHAGSLHWLCVANVSEEKTSDEHYIFDSLSRKIIRDDIVKQIANYACSPATELLLNIESVQQQRNGVDCGLFAIAFATSLAFGENPGDICYDQDLLRVHLVKCLTNQNMCKFPTRSKGRIQRCKQVNSRVELYCSCRMPYFVSSDERYDMACCSKCSCWYHRVCEKIPDSVFTNKRKKWICLSC